MALFKNKKKDDSPAQPAGPDPALSTPVQAEREPGDYDEDGDSLLPEMHPDPPKTEAAPLAGFGANQGQPAGQPVTPLGQIGQASQPGQPSGAYPLQSSFPQFPGQSGGFSSLSAPAGAEVKPLAPPVFSSGPGLPFPGQAFGGQGLGGQSIGGQQAPPPIQPGGPAFPGFGAPALPQPAPMGGALPGQAAQGFAPSAPAKGPAPGGAPGQAPGSPGGQGGGQPPSMFKAMEASRNQLLPEDLPYANEVEAALARKPKKSARLLSIAVCLFFLIMIFWASRAYVDEVTHAEGQVISSQRTQSIQNLEGGILRELLVSEGQIVEAGDVLARLDNETAESTYRDSLNKAIDNYTAIIRLEAELNRTPPEFPTDLTPWLQELTGQTVARDVSAQAAQAIQDQRSTYTARTQQRNSELQVLESVHQQRLLEIDEMLARRKQLEDNLAIATEQRDMALPLVERGSYSRLDFLGLQQSVLNLENEIETLASSIPRAQASAREAEQRITFRESELDAAITDEITRRRQELSSVRESLAAGGDRVTRTELRSPVRGTVNQIAITTVGGVVKPGESIMEIVPLDDTLLIEARVKPSDVAFLMPGQSAMVKISAFDFSIFGGLEGTLEQISADTFEDRQGGFYYLVRVRTEETAIEYRGTVHPIIPGMMATVDILIGRKTVLDYILKPILKAQQNAFRER